MSSSSATDEYRPSRSRSSGASCDASDGHAEDDDQHREQAFHEVRSRNKMHASCTGARQGNGAA
jgi:hypothetical protein